MSLSYYVQGIKPITEEYRKKLDIYKACVDLGVRPPEELIEYFEYDSHPCESRMIVSIPRQAINETSDIDRCEEYYEVDLTQLPKDITKVRFVVSA